MGGNYNPMTKSNWPALEREQLIKAHAAEIASYKEQNKRYQAVVDDLEGQLGVVLQLAKTRLKPKPITATPGAASTSTAFALAGCWHVEEEVDSRSVNGMNSYNLAEADRRIEKYVSSVLRLVEIERQGTDIDTLVFALLGDLMSGYIHEELRETNALSPSQTVLWLMERLSAVIETLRKKGNFKRIIIPCCYGNHGRTTIKPRHATGPANSYEWLLYKFLASKFTDGIEWEVAESYHTYLDVYGKTIRLHHGDGLKYQGGIGGLTIPVEKAIASWNKGRVADLDVFAHWHTRQENTKWVSCSSLIGYNAYAVSIKAAFEPPSQTFFLFNEKRGRTVTSPIFVTS